jgi:sulfotransferase family protein
MKYPIFLDSLPKSGTHLLAKALSGLPGVDHSGRHMDRKTIAEFVDKGVEFSLKGREDINIKRDYQWIERLLKSIPSGRFLTVHLNYHPEVHNALLQMNYKILLMMRDPRDVVLSWADFMTKEKTHLLYPFFSQTDLDYRVMCGIQGVGSDVTQTRRQPSIAELISGHFKWKTLGRAFLVQFERLIGEKGGGSRKIQQQVIQQLAEFFEIECTNKVINHICDNLFGGTHTFNSGLIGRWRKRFTDEHKALFKEHAGQLLIDLGYETDMDW